MKLEKLLCLVVSLAVISFAPESKALTLLFQNVYNIQMWQLGSTYPASNQWFDTPPKSVTVNFSTAVREEGSFIKVYDPYSNLINTSDTLFNGNSMSVRLPPFAEGYTGTYRVVWGAYCQCNDSRMLNGDFYFSIH